MDTKCTFNGVTIDLQMYEKPVCISGRGYIHFAKLVGSYGRDEVGKALIGQKLWDQEIRGVESFATITLNDGWKIGLLTSKQMWTGE